MRIYVAGPYSAPKGMTEEAAKAQIDKNIAEADNKALDLVKLGHTPFVPHTMMRDWENENKATREEVHRVCNEWIAQCDALLFLGSSPGADMERAVAESLGLPIFTPENIRSMRPLGCYKSEDKKEVYLTEYAQCADSYRHTYQTIWAAGSVFFAVSGGILAIWKSGQPPSGATWALALFPIWFWYMAIFRPMNRYGDKRRERLAWIETELNKMIPSLAMKHFSDDGIKSARLNFRDFFLKPRVLWYVTLLGGGITAYQIVFILFKLLKLTGLKGAWVDWVG
jgi:hypothetical protein